jgi:SPP1 gp7 family putative phage head morphogenesis protein
VKRSHDPSRTTLQRRAFVVEVVRRLRALKAAVVELVSTEDAFGLKPRQQFSPLKTNARYEFLTSSDKVDAFNGWLQSQIDANVLGVQRGEDAWTAKYIESSYKKGMMRAYTDAHKKELAAKPAFYNQSREQFLKDSFAAPETREKLKLLFTRTFEEMKGMTNAMKGQMSRVLADGLAHGRSAAEIAGDLADRIDVSMARAKTIARTEVIRAHAEGQLDSYEELGVKELGIMAEWSTAGDDAVCPLCVPLEGTVYKVEEARGLIPRHPNCRCTFIPAFADVKDKGQKRGKSRIVRAILKSVEAESPNSRTKEQAYGSSRWIGADKEISKVRTP